MCRIIESGEIWGKLVFHMLKVVQCEENVFPEFMTTLSFLCAQGHPRHSLRGAEDRDATT